VYDEAFLRRALAISAQALTTPGTEPFGAVVVSDGRIVGEGINRSLANLDPTSHGETEAIRDACRNLGSVDLSGCELYSSCEPCPLCAAAMMIAGIGRLYYAASMADAGAAFAGLTAAERLPIDVDLLRAECAAPVDGRRLPAEQHLAGEAAALLTAWAAARQRR
jgi:tRNA(Arg) A34 adenosine deaminase TadA